MGRKSNAQLEHEAKMAEGAQEAKVESEVVVPQGEAVVAPVAEEPDRKTIPADAEWRVRPEPIREQNISDEDKNALVRMHIEQMIANNRDVNLPGPKVRTLLRCPVLAQGLRNVHVLIDLDVRVIDQIKEYYFDNAVNPTPERLLIIIEEIIGRKSPYYPRVIARDWTA